MKMITFRLATEKEIWDSEHPCHARRGGPRSKITCERPQDHYRDFHSGRSKSGAWYFWKCEALDADAVSPDSR